MSGLYIGTSPPRARESLLIVFHSQVQVCGCFRLGDLFTWLNLCGAPFGRRDLVHVFRQRTLTLLKALMLQKRVRSKLDETERICQYPGRLCSMDTR